MKINHLIVKYFIFFKFTIDSDSYLELLFMGVLLCISIIFEDVCETQFWLLCLAKKQKKIVKSIISERQILKFTVEE